ncbi:kinase-like domain-containing protein [Kockovaella imperatae]|uniref:Kinase-like domain-containing protein n=1 Tax=Kockovaella imperatae TaxID=4999 RepID=A0A1Y1UUM1_9TREE|nr:kinase-like domain-containing protein [Kockovaella imperatae]ORX41274.1 kinase-like domain-containing protein [Kockovaella imperatae]
MTITRNLEPTSLLGRHQGDISMWTTPHSPALEDDLLARRHRPFTPVATSPFGHSPVETRESSSVGSPRTASFFDTSSSDLSPPAPAPKLDAVPRAVPSFSPSPLNLSREPSLQPLRLSLQVETAKDRIGGEQPDDQLSPLHQSPSLPSSPGPSWRPPVPPSSQDLKLRLFAQSPYLLGEGRYAKVYLASYKHDVGPKRTQNSEAPWKLCAAKLMASDRDSQTMGLREAFFLSRLTGTAAASVNRTRALSPLGRKLDLDPRSGRVYIVKLIAVKEEDSERRTTGPMVHGRSSSLATDARPLQRKRSSTFGVSAMTVDEASSTNGNSLSSYPSLPELAQVQRNGPQPSLSRLVLLLEHAELGTLDRFLRTSPSLVGKELWGRWAREGTEALNWIHRQGVVHADVKPGNLLLTKDFHLRLSDFGSSLLIHPTQPPTDGLGLGTLPFSPPELVDPLRSFSFPVDIFAFGATLYQCLTGREPYRGVRAMEMMHHVRRGDLWEWEERARISRIGEEEVSISSSPYPSAWRGVVPGEMVRRGGSLRIQRDASPTTFRSSSGPKRRPRLGRMSSTESLQASEELLESTSESPAGVKLWARWITRPSTPSTDAISALLNGSGEPTAETSPMRQSAHRQATLSVASPQSESTPSSPPPTVLPSLSSSYGDGSPSMTFLEGADLVSDEIRTTIRRMVQPDPAERPTAAQLRRLWRDLEIGIEIE